jgi:ribosomal protein S18 acetylase RimI-like enzyme
MIRPTVPADTPELLTLTQATGVFKDLEIEALKEVLDDFHQANAALGHQCVTLEDSGKIMGFAYFAPAAMTDRTWYLYWIAVRKQTQARGLGQKMLVYVEEAIRNEKGRVLLIETSSLPHYTLTRKFYLKNGYEQEAKLRDFYADGDHLIVFRKRLLEETRP